MNSDAHRRELLARHMAARIGPSFGTRKHPRVRRIDGTAGRHLDVAGPYRTDRKAFRVARELRARGQAKRPLRVYSRWVPGSRGRERKTPDWFVGVLRQG